MDEKRDTVRPDSSGCTKIDDHTTILSAKMLPHIAEEDLFFVKMEVEKIMWYVSCM